MGSVLLMSAFGLDVEEYTTQIVKWELPDEKKFLFSNSAAGDLFFCLAGLYSVDFLRYWAHRIGHYSFFYKTFPFSHAHHHNQVFINPMTTAISPLVHFASIATFLPLVVLGVNGLHRATIWCWFVVQVPNMTQHLGFDPLPFVSRWNHYYFYGALPWIPIYHAYHHNPYIKAANFGNTTVLFDYVFGTLSPECVYHIENGRAMEKVLDRFKDPVKLEKALDSMYTVGKGLNRLDLNNGWNMGMFKMTVL